jgi:hypothetical protein
VEPHRGILISRIPVDGLGGLIFALGMVTVCLIAVPEIRALAVVSVLGGLVLAPILRLRGH